MIFTIIHESYSGRVADNDGKQIQNGKFAKIRENERLSHE